MAVGLRSEFEFDQARNENEKSYLERLNREPCRTLADQHHGNVPLLLDNRSEPFLISFLLRTEVMSCNQS